MTYGTVEYWELVVCAPSTYHVQVLRFSDWESASDAFHRTVKERKPLFAHVYAVQRKNRRRIVTWSYDK